MMLPIHILLNIYNRYADADARSMTPSKNTRSYTLRRVPSSPGRSFFNMQSPSSKSTFFCHTFSLGFLMYRPSWIRSILLIRNFFTLGPRPNKMPPIVISVHVWLLIIVFCGDDDDDNHATGLQSTHMF